MSDIHIRAARPEEAAALTELAMRAKASWGYDAAFMEQCRAEMTLTADRMAQWSVWVAEHRGRLAGWIALALSGAGAELEDLMVEPAFHGLGVGRALLDTVLDACRERAVATIGLDADPNAEPIYLKLGFTTVGRVPSGSIPGRTLPRMVRPV